MVGQSWGSASTNIAVTQFSNSALLNMQLWELCETCGKVGKRKVFLEDNQDVSGALELTS